MLFRNKRINKFLTKFFDLCELNLIFIFFSLPIITIGVSLTASFHTMEKIIEEDNTAVFSVFLISVKENWKQVTAPFLLFVVIMVSGILGFWMAQDILGNGNIMGFIYFIILLYTTVILIYYFPIQAKFQDNLRRTLVNSCLLAIRHFPQTIQLLLIVLIPFFIIISLRGRALLFAVIILIVIGFSIVMYLMQLVFSKRIFPKYIS